MLLTRCKRNTGEGFRKGGEEKNMSKRLVSAIAAVAMLLNSAAPALATTLEISGNGDSNNEINVDVDQETNVVQDNTANISNDVDVTANTGGNTASRNTGGDVLVDTGNSEADVTISNTANSNVADVECCESGDVDVLISGNGDGSTNKVDLDVNQYEGKGEDPGSGTHIYQDNYAKVKNDVDVTANTGDNRASSNTGGDVLVFTGNAKIADEGVKIVNSVNSNSARVGGNAGGDEGPALSVRILGNGSDSKNTIDLDFDREVIVSQDNIARITNDVDVNALTGNNWVARNTGGTAIVDTGNAYADVMVDNMANFNWADVDCGCLMDILAKVHGNGDGSENKIRANLDDELVVFQDNDWSCDKGYGWWWFWRKHGYKKPCNDVDATADTGNNAVNRNTAEGEGDPAVVTGDSEVDVTVGNTGNSNVFGETPQMEIELPWWVGFNLNLSLDLDWEDLLGLIG